MLERRCRSEGGGVRGRVTPYTESLIVINVPILHTLCAEVPCTADRGSATVLFRRDASDQIDGALA